MTYTDLGNDTGYWTIETEGFACQCQLCDDLNGTYVVASAGMLPFGTCLWQYVLPAPICGVAKVRLTVATYSISPPAWRIAVELVDAAGQDVMYAQKMYAARPDCMNLDSESLGPMTCPGEATSARLPDRAWR